MCSVEERNRRWEKKNTTNALHDEEKQVQSPFARWEVLTGYSQVLCNCKIDQAIQGSPWDFYFLLVSDLVIMIYFIVSLKYGTKSLDFSVLIQKTSERSNQHTEGSTAGSYTSICNMDCISKVEVVFVTWRNLSNFRLAWTWPWIWLKRQTKPHKNQSDFCRSILTLDTQ